MGLNDRIDVSDIEQEILAEWYPDYLGDANEHPDYERIYLAALDRWVDKRIAAAIATVEIKEDR